MSSECKHVKLDTRNDQSEVICAMCKQCLITANHDVCMLNYVNDMNSRGKKQKANVSNTENQKKQKPKVKKPKKVGSNERLASPKPSKPRFCLRWSPTGRFFDIKGKIIASSESESQPDCSNGDNACTSNPSEPKIKRFPNSTSSLGRLSKFFLGTVRFGNDHVAAILGFGDLQWGNILITRVYFVEGLGHNLFSVGQFCDSDLEVAFRRNSCFVRNLDGVDLLKGNRSTNLYTINLHEMNDREVMELGAKGDIGFFIGYSADSCAYRIGFTPKDKENHGDNECDHPRETSDRRTSRPVLTRIQLRSDGGHVQILKNPSLRLLEWKLLGYFVAFVHNKSFTVLSNDVKTDFLVMVLLKEDVTPRHGADGIVIRFSYMNHFFKGTIDPNVVIRRFGLTTFSGKGLPLMILSLVLHTLVNQSPCASLNQSNYVLEILKKIWSGDCDPLAKPTEKHLKEVKRIFRYLRGTVNTGLWYTKDSGFKLTGFLDADYAGCKDTFKITSGRPQFLGEKLVSWSSKKQDCIVLSTEEAEYVSLSACCA
ncbi:hypothetical protein Tco_0733403 [Tanacetum coccineum]